MSDIAYINHVGLVLDASSSMDYLAQKVVQVADNEIASLARRSTEMDQETRATVYQFADTTTCLYYDKDVLRLPSLKDKYKVYGNTALIDATMKAIQDLEKTATLYGDHAFLIYVLTDGAENRSRLYTSGDLATKLQRLPDNWTIACLVPNQNGIYYAERYGFLKGNIAQWDATSSVGLDKAANVVRTATDNWMQARAQGVRGTKNIFTLDPTVVTSGRLDALDKSEYELYLLHQERDMEIRPYVENQLNATYRVGHYYYQLTKAEDIQADKKIYIRDLVTDKYYGGPQARALLKLPNETKHVHPASHPDYQIFVQSNSYNRKLVANTYLLYVR